MATGGKEFMKTLFPALLFIVASTSGRAQYADSPTAILDEVTLLAGNVVRRVHIEHFDFSTKNPKIELDQMSMYDGPKKNTVHEALWRDVPPPIQGIFNQWASYTDNYPDGQQLFHDMFYRFFFVHELGHWLSDQILAQRHDKFARRADKNSQTHRWQYEMAANRISIAWWREQDPVFLEKIVNDFRVIEGKLPSPVPPGEEVERFFTANYEKLAEDPNKYGWYQLQMVILAYDQRPIATFQQAIGKLTAENYDE